MERRIGTARWMRAALIGGLLLLLVLVAKIHACVCTGGTPIWRSVFQPT